MTQRSANDDTKPATPPSGLEAARDKVTGAAATARSATVDAYEAAREKVGTTVHEAADKASAAYGDVREKLGKAVEDTREAAGVAGRRAADLVQDNPVGALVGGLALGAIAAALIPRTERETKALGALGQRINGAAKDAATAAKEAGREKLGELGLTPDRAQDTVSKLFADVAKAATAAGTAAASSVRER